MANESGLHNKETDAQKNVPHPSGEIAGRPDEQAAPSDKLDEATETIPPANGNGFATASDYAPHTPASGSLTTVERPNAPQGFRVHLGGSPPPSDSEQDASVLAFELDRRRQAWWRWRKFFFIGLPGLAVIFFLVSLMGLVWGWAGTTFWIFFILLVATGLFYLYCWLTLPRVMSYGRAYRRLVSIPLARGGIVWCDAATPAPNFPALRDSFFTLYQDSAGFSERAQPVTNAEDTVRKKQALHDLSSILKPVLNNKAESYQTPFIGRDRAGVLDRIELEPLDWNQIGEMANRSLPLGMQHINNPLELQRFTHDVEQYATMKADNSTAAIVQVNEATAAPLHRQIAVRINENFGLVGTEIDRWREQFRREREFYNGVQTRYQEADERIKTAFDRSIVSLEEEIAPATAQLNANVEFYRLQITAFYEQQKQVVETRRDAALGKLDRERQELDRTLDERRDEQALAQAEFKSLNDQRLRLETSTDNRFESLKGQLNELVRKNYSLPPVPFFRSDYGEEASASTAQEAMDQLAELRAETRLTTNAVNNALNRFARLRFEPLDEMARLEEQIHNASKWQATSYLGNLINFKQSGQLLALAGEVSEAAGVYLDAVADFERLNRRWCALEISIRQLSLTSYANRLQEAQEYLTGLSQVAGQLHSSLLSATHNPEMARPTTFQNIYELATGLQRELEELGALASAITNTEDRLNELNNEIAGLQEQLEQNHNETERIRTDASIKLYEISQKTKQISEKIAELAAARTQRIRAHIDELGMQRGDVLKTTKTGATELGYTIEITEQILKRHLERSDRLLERARKLHQGLETNLASIVQDFQNSVFGGRNVEAASELFVPVWYFQFKDRPVWKQRVYGFAGCYTNFEPAPVVAADRHSLWRFVATDRPAVYYRLKEDTNLSNLVGAQNLDYPAGKVETATDVMETLANENLLNRWLVKLTRFATVK
jgi:hypothetical protein